MFRTSSVGNSEKRNAGLVGFWRFVSLLGCCRSALGSCMLLREDMLTVLRLRFGGGMPQLEPAL